MDTADRGITADYDTYISRALATDGGHLSIGRGGFSLYFGRGAHLSGYDCEPVKAACIAAGLPPEHRDGFSAIAGGDAAHGFLLIDDQKALEGHFESP